MRRWISVLTVALFWTGCGGAGVSGAGQSDRASGDQPAKSKIAKRIEDPSVVAAGDDQHVLAGKSVTLRATPLDRDKRFRNFVWKENGTVLASSRQCELVDLGMGLHEIVLEAEAADGTTYIDRVEVEIKGAEAGNSLPEARALHFTTPEDEPFSGSLRGSDSDGDPLHYVLVSRPEHGTLSGSPVHMHYTPDPDFYGEDSFLFKTNDGKIDSDLATVTITVEPRNDAPVAEAMQLQTPQESPVTAVLQASDKEGDALSFVITQQPVHGSVTLHEGEVTYTPQNGFSGEDSFRYKATDGTEDSREAIVAVTVRHINHAPQISDTAMQTNEDTALDIPLSAEDSDGDAVTFRLTSAAQMGTAQISGNQLHYQPDPDRFGTETLTYVANDGHVDSAPATVTIHIAAQNDAPVASPLTLTTDEDQPATTTLLATDAENDPLAFAIVTQPQHGSVTVTDNHATYTPDADFHGTDTFAYRATDGIDDSAAATVSITVNPVNDLPQLSDMSFTTQQDQPLPVTLSATDPDNDPLTYLHDNPAHGTLSGSGANLTYTPQNGFSGTDTFTYRVNDTHADSAVHTVTITVTALPNSAPVVTGQNSTLDEDASVAITLHGNDTDNDTLTFTIISAPIHGTVTLSGAVATYTPQPNYNGADSFTFRANDGTADSNVATVSLQIDPVNDQPTATPQNLSGNEDSSLTITLTGEDIDGDTLQDFTVVTQPLHGTLSCNGAFCTYTPVPDFSGSDLFVYSVSDGMLTSDPATVTLTVNPQNDAPVATSATMSLHEDSSVVIPLDATDVENDSMTYTLVAAPQHGTAVLDTNSVTYTPAPDYHGSDSFTFKANDGTADSNVATVTLTVTPVNDAPAATAQNLAVDEDNPLSVTLSGNDADGDSLTYTVSTPPAHGTLSGTAPALTYTPDPNFNGSDHFGFRVSDGNATSAEANVTITVNSINDAPVAVAGNDISVVNGTTVNLSAAGSYDPDGNITSYEWKEGSTLIASSRDFSTTFPTGVHTLTLTVTDNDGSTAADTLLVTVTASQSVSFTKITSLASQQGAIDDILMADMDNDGDCDLLVVSETSGKEDISWYRNDGNLTYSYMGAIFSNVDAKVVAFDDLDGDNFPDIVYGKDSLHVCTNSANVGTVTFSCADATLYTGQVEDDNIQAVIIADMDGMNGKDIVVALSERGLIGMLQKHEIIAYLQKSDHSFDSAEKQVVLNPIHEVTDIAAADNDNDGDIDLVVSTSDTGVYYIQNDQNGTDFVKSSLHTVSSTQVAFADIDGDQKLDLVSVQGIDATFQTDALPGSAVLTQLEPCSVIDIDGDGYTDIVPDFSPTTGVTWYRHNGDNSAPQFAPQTIDTVPAESEVRVIKAGDLDNNGDTDIDIVTGNSQGEITIYRNDLQ